MNDKEPEIEMEVWSPGGMQPASDLTHYCPYKKPRKRKAAIPWPPAVRKAILEMFRAADNMVDAYQGAFSLPCNEWNGTKRRDNYRFMEMKRSDFLDMLDDVVGEMDERLATMSSMKKLTKNKRNNRMNETQNPEKEKKKGLSEEDLLAAREKKEAQDD